MREVSRRRALLGCGTALVALTGCTASSRDADRSTTDGSTPTGETSTASDDSDAASSDADPDGEYADWAVSLPTEPSAIETRGSRAYVAVDRGEERGSKTGTLLSVGADGAVHWRYDTDAPVQSIHATEDAVYAVAGRYGTTLMTDVSIHGVERDGGERRWRRTETPDGDTPSLVGVAEASLVVGYSNDNLEGTGESTVGYATADGSDRWSTPTGDVRGGVVDGAAFVADPARVRAIDPDSGDERWTYSPEGPMYDDPAVVDDTVAVGTQTVVVVDRESGDVRWRHGEQPDMDGATVLGGTVYAQGPHVAALDADGTERWRYDAGGRVGAVGAGGVFGTDGIRGFTSDESAFFGLDSDGTERFRRDPPTEGFALSHVHDGTLVGYGDGAVRLLDPADGAELETITLGGSVAGPPTALDSTLVAVDGDSLVGLSL